MPTDTIDSTTQSQSVQTEPPFEQTTPPLAATTAANQPPAALNAQLDQFEQHVGKFEDTYTEQAEQKNGLQKAGDWARAWVNKDASGQGHGDDQFKNIANTQIEIDKIKSDLSSGQAKEQEARARLNVLRQDFGSEAERVGGWQERNQQAGKFVHQAGRVATVTATGIGVTVASGGNIFLGGAAALGAGNLYDAATVAAGEADKAMGNGQKDGKPSAFTPELDTKQSFAGLAANAATGEKITGQDVFNAITNTALDFVSGAGAGNGVKTARTAIAAATTTREAVQAGATASVKNTLLQTGASYGVQSASTQVNPYLTDEQKQTQQSKLTHDTLTHLPGQLIFSAASSGAGVAFQPASKLGDIGVHLGVDGISNTGEGLTTSVLQGKGLTLSDEQLINAAVSSTTGALHNIKQRPPQSQGAPQIEPAPSQRLLPGSPDAGDTEGQPTPTMLTRALGLPTHDETAHSSMSARSGSDDVTTNESSEANNDNSLMPIDERASLPLGRGASGAGFFSIDPESSLGQTLRRIDRSSSERDIVDALEQVRDDAGLTSRGQRKKNVAVLVLTDGAGKSYILGAKARADTQIDLSDRLINLPLSVPLQGGDENIVTVSSKDNLAVRAEDAERTLLEGAARLIRSDDAIAPWRAVLVSELAPCPACSIAMDQFTELTGTPVEMHSTAARSTGALEQQRSNDPSNVNFNGDAASMFEAPRSDWSDHFVQTEGGNARRPLLRAIDEVAAGDGTPPTALDLGSGAGVATRKLLDEGFQVTAIDADPAARAYADRAFNNRTDQGEFRQESLADASLPPSDLVWSGLTLPYLDNASFAQAWQNIDAAVKPGGVFAGDFFGPSHAYNTGPDSGKTFLDRSQVEALFKDYEILQLTDIDTNVKTTGGGDERFHVYTVVARKNQASVEGDAAVQTDIPATTPLPGTPGSPAQGPITLFQPETAFEQRAHSTDGKTVLVLPDTHGRDDLQQKAFDYLRAEQPWVFENGDGATVVSLGDTIDKGPNSAHNVEALINRADEQGVSEVITHMGNHEMWITEWLNRPGAVKYAHDWIANRGGKIALESYERFAQENPERSNFSLDGLDLANMPVRQIEANGRTTTEPDNSGGFYTELHQRMVDSLPRNHLDFYDNLQSSTRIGDYFFSHAGADPKRALDDQGMSALAWIRDPYLNHEGEWLGEPNTTAVSGHTILQQPLIQDNKFAIDLGTFMTGDFMAAILQNDLVRFAIFRKDAEPVFTDLRGGFEQGLFAPSFDPSLVIKNPKKK